MRVSGHEELGRLSRRLRAAADGGLRRDLDSGLTRATPAVLAATRRAVAGASFPGEPSRGLGGGSGLRARLAAATRSRPRADGVQLYVDGAAVGQQGHRLAMLTDTELAPRWRHPVHGNRHAWVTQRGQPWFFTTIRAHEPRYAAAVQQAMDESARRIEDA